MVSVIQQVMLGYFNPGNSNYNDVILQVLGFLCTIVLQIFVS